MDRRDKEPVEIKIYEPPVPEKYTTVDEIQFPLEKNYGLQHTNFVMNQTKGKMPMKDLAGFMKAQREEM